MPGFMSYITPPEQQPNFADYLKQIQGQAAVIPPDQAQMQMSQAPATPPSVSDIPMVENFKPGQGLEGYLPAATRAQDRALMEQYRAQSQDALNQQKSGLGQLEQYRNDFANTPVSVDYSALGALADNMNEAFGQKTNLFDAAQKTRGLTADQKNDKLLKLQEYIQQSKGNMSKESLTATAEMLKMLHQNDQTNMMAEHYKNMEKATGDRSSAFLDRNELMRDAQARQVANDFDNDKIIKAQQERLNQIKLDHHTLDSGGIITPAVLAEIGTGIATAIGGKGSASLTAQEKQEISSLEADLAKKRQYLVGKPMNALSKENREFLINLLNRLEGGYGNNLASRAVQIRKGRAYHANQYADKMLDSKVAEYQAYAQPNQNSGPTEKPVIPSVDEMKKMSPDEVRKLWEAHQ